MYEDTYRIRQLNEMKIQHESQTIDLLNKCLSESEDNTLKMNNMLNNFESRLTSLHDLIVPIYDSTNTLQIKHSNITKTVSKLDNIIEYYNSVKNLSLVIQAGPGKDINTYISQLNKLRLAIDYFEVNKNQSQKKQNEDLWVQGKLNVEREFDQLLSKCSDTARAIIDRDTDIKSNDQQIDAKSLNLKESDLNQMNCIIEWFKQVEPKYLDQLYMKMIEARNQLILDKLKKMSEKSRASGNQKNTGNLMSMSPGQSGSMNRSKSIVTSNSSSNFSQITNRRTENLLSSSGDLKRKQSKVNMDQMGHSGNRSQSVAAVVFEQDFEQSECVNFIYCARLSLRMFYIENIFIGELFDANQKMVAHKILERLFDPVLKFLRGEAEQLATNMKMITSKLTSKYVIAMFSVLSDLAKMKPAFISVLEGMQKGLSGRSSVQNSSIDSFLDIFVEIERACSSTLKDIIEEIKNDPSSVQPNGNIHSITTEVITFIKNLLPFDLIAGLIANVLISDNKQQMPSEIEKNLRHEALKTSNQPFTQLAYKFHSEAEIQTYRIALTEYFYKLFRWLNLSLKNKAENYENQNLKWIFLLNNSYKISKLFSDASQATRRKKTTGKCETLDELFLQTGKRDLKLLYDSDILNFKREYSKCWSRLLSFIRDLNEKNPFTEGKLKDKERQLLKDRFSGFNKEFEEIYESQKKFYIPSEQSELAEILRQDNTIYIISQYKRFYETYSRIQFATNREKYVKYTPEDLTERIREFFSAY